MSKKKKVRKFLLLHGLHSDGEKTYKRGDKIDTTTDLNRMNSSGSVKFREIGAAPSSDEPELKTEPEDTPVAG